MIRILGVSLGLLLALALPRPATANDAPAPETIVLWPGTPPGETGAVGAEKEDRKPGDTAPRSITNVTKPTLTIHRPESGKETGVAVVVCPGGGYTNLAWDHEGEQVARWLNSIGVTAALLKYRVPRRPGSPQDQPPVQALMDAQRALSLVRSRASGWKIDPRKVGILGFSAGGHLSAWSATNGDRRAYEAIDDSDKASFRPDFAVVIYPGGILRQGEVSPEIRVDAETPPVFLAHAGDDAVTPQNSIVLYLALKKAKVPVELHIYASGGHGFGLRPTGKPSATWPARCEEWMHDLGILKPAAKG